jgi:hypothetical protein
MMYLWSDLEDNQQSHNTMGRGRTRRLSEAAVFSVVREWLFNEYVADYCRSLATTRIFHRCFLIDGLGVAAKGSKALSPCALHPTQQSIPPSAQTLAQENKPITLHNVFLTHGSSKRKDARQNESKELNLSQESSTLAASWLEAAPQIMQEIESSPAIFLLNPLGHTLFTNDDLTVLYKRTAPTELCLLLSHKQIETLFLTAMRSPAYATVLTALLRTDRWKTFSTRDSERKKVLCDIMNLFAASLQRNFVLPIQQITLPVLVRPGTIETMSYTLIFATRRQDSFVSMNDALCRYQRTTDQQHHRGVLGEEWFEMQYKERLERECQQLREDILQLGRTQRIRHWPELRQQVLATNFGRFLLPDYDSILRKLLRDGAVRCEWRQRAIEDETERLPDNNDTLFWNEERTMQRGRGGTRGKH